MDSLSGKTVLVTGGAGFIGHHLVNALVQDNDVRVLDDLSTGRRGRVHDDAKFIEGDLLEDVSEAVAGVDVVFHEAAQISVPYSVDHPLHSHDVNVDGTLALLEAAREEDARVVGASSAAIYGDPVALPVTEDHPKEPLSPYGLEKLAVDHYLRLFDDLYGLETVALRYFNVFGPGQTGEYAGVISAFLDMAATGDPITVHGDGTQTRDFVHVDDVVDANLRAATTEHVGEAFNVATGIETSVRELAETIRDVTGTTSDIVHVDPRDGDIDESQASIEKARELLGYEPTVGLRDGLERLVSSGR